MKTLVHLEYIEIPENLEFHCTHHLWREMNTPVLPSIGHILNITWPPGDENIEFEVTKIRFEHDGDKNLIPCIVAKKIDTIDAKPEGNRNHWISECCIPRFDNFLKPELEKMGWVVISEGFGSSLPWERLWG